MVTILNYSRILILALTQFIPVIGFFTMLILHASENKKFSIFYIIEKKFAATKEAEKSNEKIVGFFMCLILLYHFIGLCKIINILGGYESNLTWFIDKPEQISNDVQNYINLFKNL